jgi:hypothetical protein
MTKLIINCETGETTERELNKAEKDQQKIDEISQAQMQDEINSKAEARQAIAERLGLTADELKILFG